MKTALSSMGRRPERGFFLVVVLLAICSLLLVYVTANGRRLSALKQEVRIVEQKQVKHWESRATTNFTSSLQVPTANDARTTSTD